MPIDPWRGRLWAAAPLPPLCSALTAYRSDAPGMRELIVEAAGRLINGSERHLHPDVNPSDQTALWFAYVLTAPRTRLRVLALPEESRYVQNSRPEASAHWSSSTPRHPQSKLRAASSLGQPRPIGRCVLAGRPYRPCFLHRNLSARANHWAVRTCSWGRRRGRSCSPSLTSARAGWDRSRATGGASTAVTRCMATATRTSRSSVCYSPPRWRRHGHGRLCLDNTFREITLHFYAITKIEPGPPGRSAG